MNASLTSDRVNQFVSVHPSLVIVRFNVFLQNPTATVGPHVEANTGKGEADGASQGRSSKLRPVDPVDVDHSSVWSFDKDAGMLVIKVHQFFARLNFHGGLLGRLGGDAAAIRESWEPE